MDILDILEYVNENTEILIYDNEKGDYINESMNGFSLNDAREWFDENYYRFRSIGVDHNKLIVIIN